MSATPRWLHVANNIIEEANKSPWREPANYISLDSINGIRGRVPMALLMERVWIDNCPQCQDFNRLSPAFREPVAGLGYVGGIANIPVNYARDQRLDPRDPWTSLYMLATRLRDIAEGRARQYSDMWDQINCAETESVVLAMGATSWPGWSSAISDLVNKYSDVGWRAISQGTVEDRGTTGGPVQMPNKVCIDGVPANVGEPGMHILPYYEAGPRNFYGVYNDLGFWKAVLLEERVTTPFSTDEQRSRVGIMDRLWTEFLRGGLWGFLLDRGGNGGVLVAGMLWYHGLVWTISPFAWMQDVILHYNEYPSEVRDRLQLSPSDISMLRGHLDAVNRIVQGAELTRKDPTWAGPDGANLWTQPEWVGHESTNPAQISLAVLRPSTVGWSTETDRWAGGLFQVPGQVEPPRQRPAERQPQPTKPPTSTASKVHPAIPFLIGASVPLLGYLVVGGRGSGKGRSGP